MSEISKLMFAKKDICLPPLHLFYNGIFSKAKLLEYFRIFYHEELSLRFSAKQKVEKYLKVLNKSSPFSNQEMINLWIWVKDKFPQESIAFWINKNTKKIKKLYISTSTKISTCLIYFVLKLFKQKKQKVKFCKVDDKQLSKMFFDLDNQEERKLNPYDMEKFANNDEFLLYHKIKEIPSTDLGHGLKELREFQ